MGDNWLEVIKNAKGYYVPIRRSRAPAGVFTVPWCQVTISEGDKDIAGKFAIGCYKQARRLWVGIPCNTPELLKIDNIRCRIALIL
jgi:hypothetical protein